MGKIDINFKNLTNLLKTSNYKKLNLKIKPKDLCVLSNKYLLAANYDSNNLTMYDTEFNLVKTINRINNREIQPGYITSNKIDKIYICERHHNRIVMTDFDFNFIRQIGSKGVNNDQFNFPCGILYDNNSVYVCDSKNKRLQKFDSDLGFQKSYSLDFEPWKLRITNSVACIVQNKYGYIYFYDLNSFQLLTKHRGSNSAILGLDYCFYQLRWKLNKICCYNSHGNFIDEIHVKLEDDIKFDGFEILCYFNEKFLIYTQDCERVIVF